MTHLLCRLGCAKENWDEGQPHYTCGVHSEADGLGFIEVFRYVPRLDGVDGAGHHQQDAVAQWTNDLKVCDVTLQHAAGQLGVNGFLLIVIDDGVRWVHGEPHQHAQQLHTDQTGSDGNLGGGTDEARGRHRLLALLEDAVDAVGLGEQRGVADAHAQAQEDPPEGAHGHVGLGDHEEGDDVTQEDPRQQHVAQLSARRPHDGRVVVAHERRHDEDGGDDSKHGQEDGDYRPWWVPLQLDDGDGLAGGSVGVGPHVVGTQSAGGLVVLVLVTITELTVPAARHALYPLFPLSSLAGQTAHGDGHILLPIWPLKLLQLGERWHSTRREVRDRGG